MFPRKCSQPPCMNMEVMIVGQRNSAGTMANIRVNVRKAGSVSDCSYRNARLFRTMMRMVMKGNVRVGMTSRSGIIAFGILPHNI